MQSDQAGPRWAESRATVIIPAYNERDSLGPLLIALCAAVAADERISDVLVIDDGSVDGTAEVAAAAGIRVISHRVNLGYGAALKTGIRHAETPFVVTMDADGQHRPEDLLAVCAAAADNDMVVGRRTGLMHSPLWRMPGKWVLNAMARYLSQQDIPDLNSGLRAFRRSEVLKYLHLCPDGFSFSTTITIAFLSRGLRVEYVPIEVQPRVGKSTVSLKTGYQTLILVLRLASLFSPLRVFLPAAFACWVMGALWALPYLALGRGLSTGAALLGMTGVLLVALGLLSDQVSQLRLERYA